jgi:ribosomal protein S5
MKNYDLLEGRTLHHDIVFEYHKLKIKMFKKPPGYSVRAQRNAYDVCMALGIQDISVNIMEGTTNPITIVQAMFHAFDYLHQSPSQVAAARGKTVEEIMKLQ